MFRGSREQGVDYFDDFFDADGGQAGHGILKGGGMAGYENLTERLSGQGLEIKMPCRKCGKDAVLTLDFEELFVCGANGPGEKLLLPKGWHYSQNNGAMYPALRCGGCGAEEGYCPQLTPDECRRHVNAAVNRALISPDQVGQWKHKVAMYRQGG